MQKSPLFRAIVLLAVGAIMLAWLPHSFAGTTGKIAGVVKDKSTGEPIPGANVIIEGTTLGASTDSQGRYFILNVPPGEYTLRVTFIGYKAVRKQNVRVSVDLTTEINFEMESTVLEAEEVVVVAERPLVEKTLTATASKYSAEELNNTLPVATFNDLLETTPSMYRGYIRGGHKFETKYLVDGVDVSDAYFSYGQGAYGGEVGHPYHGYRTSDDRDNVAVTMSQGALEEVTVFAGTFNAEYPAATAGIVNVVTKEGGQEFKASFFNRTLATNKRRHKGTSVYTDAPFYFAEKEQLQSAGDPTSLRRAALYTWTPEEAREFYNYDPADSSSIGRSTELNFTFSGPLTSKGGFFLEGRYSNDIGPFPFERTKRIGGSLKLHYNLSADKKITGMFQFNDGGELFNFVNWKFNPKWKYNMNAAPRYKDLSTVGYIKWTNAISAKTFYEVQVSHVRQLTKVGYPDDDGDGFPELNDKGDFISFKDLNEYIKYVGGNGEPGSENGYVFGDTTFTKRVFFSSETDPDGWNDLNKSKYSIDGISHDGFFRTAYPTPLYQRIDRSRLNFKFDLTSQVTFNHQIKTGISYTIHNVDVDAKQSELYGAGRKYPTSKFHVNIYTFNPKEFAFYIQDRIEFQGLIVNVGGRVDGFDTDTELFENEWDPLDEIKTEAGELVELRPKRGKKVGMRFFFSPRVGVSHPVTENFAMHYSFGRFFQYPNYASLYQDYNFTNYTASPTIVTVRPDQDPIRSTNYELGAQWAINDMLLFNFTAYYRDVENYRVARYTLTTSENRGLTFQTTWGYADSRGIEIELSKRPGKWWGGRISYSYSFIKESVRASSNFRLGYATAADSLEFARLPWELLDRMPSFERNVLVTSGGTNTLAGGYDRPHRINGTLMLFFPGEINATITGEWTSGFYFQPTQNIYEDPFFQRNRDLLTGPNTFFLNARVSKLFRLADLDIELFGEVRNLTDRTNIKAISNRGFNANRDDLIIWELGRDRQPNTGDELKDPEGVFMMPTDIFGRPFYLNAREWYVGLKINFR